MVKVLILLIMIAPVLGCAKEQINSDGFASAKILFNEGKIEESEKQILETLEIDKKNIKCLMLLGKIQFFTSKNNEAIITLKELLNYNSNYREAQILLVRLYLNESKLAEAEELIDKLLADDETDPRLLSLNGELLQAKGEPEAALTYYKHAAAFSDEAALNYIATARIYYYFKMKEKALQDYKIAYNLLSENNILHDPLGEVIEEIENEI